MVNILDKGFNNSTLLLILGLLVSITIPSKILLEHLSRKIREQKRVFTEDRLTLAAFPLMEHNRLNNNNNNNNHFLLQVDSSEGTSANLRMVAL
ncbi:hypothetical protein C0J52_16113 [Blattella germanica]|nr:hypothetical protein C0J52_16113 [Blattella germanica]